MSNFDLLWVNTYTLVVVNEPQVLNLWDAERIFAQVDLQLVMPKYTNLKKTNIVTKIYNRNI